MSRPDDLYKLGLDKYQELMEYDLGTNNALLAAIATMIADSEKLRTWKSPSLIGDAPTFDTGGELDEEATKEWAEGVNTKGARPSQLRLGNW